MDRGRYQKRNHRKADSLMRELQSYERQGTHLYLDNHLSRPGEIVHACMFAEDNNYMRDFVSDDREHITEIHFNRISGQK